MNSRQQNYKNLKTFVFEQGGLLFGVGDLIPLRSYMLLKDSVSAGLTHGISIGVRLSPDVLRGITDKPTLLYKWHYRQANNLLDKIAFMTSQKLLEQGYQALPVPASQVIDWEKQAGHVSHRMLAEAAGLGWRGRNNLLVTEKYGAHIRLVSILTNMPLSLDQPMENRCGPCRKCIAVCPARALGEDAKKYDLNRCLTLLKEFAKLPGIGHQICGICVKTCSGKRIKEVNENHY